MPAGHQLNFFFRFKMKTKLALLSYYFNFSGILNLKVNNGNVETSKLVLLCNIFSIPVLLLILIYMPHNIYDETLKNPDIFSYHTSIFLAIMTASKELHHCVVAVIFVYTPIFKNRLILNFGRDCVKSYKIIVRSKKDSLDKLINKCCVDACLAIFLSTLLNVLGDFIAFKISMLSLLVSLIISLFAHISFPLMVLFGCFFQFLLLLLRTMHSILEESSSVGLNLKRSDEILLNFSILYKLITDFSEAFGSLFSLVTFYNMAEITYKVIRTLKCGVFVDTSKFSFVFLSFT